MDALLAKLPACTESDYRGWKRYDFELLGNNAVIIVPDAPLSGMQWVWRTEFLGAFDNVDVALLRDGYYLMHYSISDMYGCPASVELMKGFYDYIISLGFAGRTVPIGLSRGGLYAVHFAARYPEAVRAMYLDAPVLDIRSWPLGMMTGIGSNDKEKDECLSWYGLTMDTVADFRGNPLDMTPILLENGIPLALVAGDADVVVPHLENCQIMADAYRAAGGKLLYILKPGCGHHPHSLDDPTPVVEFLAGCR